MAFRTCSGVGCLIPKLLKRSLRASGTDSGLTRRPHGSNSLCLPTRVLLIEVYMIPLFLLYGRNLLSSLRSSSPRLRPSKTRSQLLLDSNHFLSLSTYKSALSQSKSWDSLPYFEDISWAISQKHLKRDVFDFASTQKIPPTYAPRCANTYCRARWDFPAPEPPCTRTATDPAARFLGLDSLECSFWSSFSIPKKDALG